MHFVCDHHHICRLNTVLAVFLFHRVTSSNRQCWQRFAIIFWHKSPRCSLVLFDGKWKLKLVKQLLLTELNPFKLLDVRDRIILFRKSIIVPATVATSCHQIVLCWSCCCYCRGEPQYAVAVAGGEALRFSQRGQGVGWRAALGANQGKALKTDVGQNWKDINKEKDNRRRVNRGEFLWGPTKRAMRCRKWRRKM